MDETHLGISGTRDGMTADQRRTLQIVLNKFRGWFHHGDCIGVDEQAHNMARRAGYRIMIHPPEKPEFRAYCKTEPGWLFIERPYLERNRHIVGNSVRMIIVPKETDMPASGGGGTWFTFRYAIDRKRPVKVIWPNGKVRNYDW